MAAGNLRVDNPRVGLVVLLLTHARERNKAAWVVVISCHKIALVGLLNTLVEHHSFYYSLVIVILEVFD